MNRTILWTQIPYVDTACWYYMRPVHWHRTTVASAATRLTWARWASHLPQIKP